MNSLIILILGIIFLVLLYSAQQKSRKTQQKSRALKEKIRERSQNFD
jgi:preprotein translocase subunit YajC